MPSMGSGAAEGLQQVLQRLFLEAQFKQKAQMDEAHLAENARQANQQHDLGERQLRSSEGLRQATLDATIADRQERGADRDAAREIQSGADLRGNLQMMPKGTPIDNPDTIVGMAKRGMGGMLKPVQNEPRFEFSGTQQAENAAGSTGAREESLNERERHNRRMEELNALRASWGPTPIQIQTTGAEGQAVTKVLPRNQATGQEFSAAPTTDQRNRQAASGRVAPVLAAVAELSEKINVGKGVAAKAVGEIERKKAQLNLNDDISEYEAIVSGFTPLVARALGHTGVLTQQDVDSARAILPAPGDSKSVRDRKIARVTSLMDTLDGQTTTSPPTQQPGAPSKVTITSIKQIQ